MARATPSAFELDELRQRVHARVELGQRSQHRSRFAQAPLTFVAAPLTVGLVLVSGVGVAIAGGHDGNGDGEGGHGEAGDCQYENEWTKDYEWQDGKHGKVDETLTWDGKKLTTHIDYSQGSWSYKFGNGPTYNIKSKSYTTTAPYHAPSLTVTANGAPYTISITW